MAIHATLASFGESQVIELADDATVEDLKAAGRVLGGLTLRFNGGSVEDGAPVEDQGVYTAVPPAAKHGA